MGNIKFNVAFLFSFASFLLLSQHPNHVSCSLNKTGFTLKLIPPNSVHSPLYAGNLTHEERIRRLVQMSESRLRSIRYSTTQGSVIRPPVDHSGHAYNVKVGIGVNPATVYLLLDTGSDLTWTQIRQCNPCFPQDEPIYSPPGSKSYTPISAGHPLCTDARNGQCTYTISYADKTFTNGILANERFIFDAASGGTGQPTLVFGCSNSSDANMLFPSRKIGGIMGMGRGRESFVNQLVPYTGGKRFAYCMVDVDSSKVSYLRFGQDIVVQSNAQTTPFFKRRFLPSTYDHYYLTLIDISVGEDRLNLPAGTFDVHIGGTGGCIIDSGSAISYIVRPAYDAVKKALKDYFSGAGVIEVDGRDVHLDLCFRYPSVFNEFPTMDMHFQGATLHLEARNVFTKLGGRRFCLLMLPEDEYTILGAAQQMNFQMVYDVDRERLSFAPANCDGN